MNEMSSCCSGSVYNPSCAGNEGRCNDCKEMCSIARTIEVKDESQEYEAEFYYLRDRTYWLDSQFIKGTLKVMVFQWRAL